MGAGLLESGVLGNGGLGGGVGTGAGVAKLHLGSEKGRAGSDTPRHQRLHHHARADCFADGILFNATHLRAEGEGAKEMGCETDGVEGIWSSCCTLKEEFASQILNDDQINLPL